MAHKDKEFSWSSWAVDNKVTVLVVTVLIALTGLMAYLAMPREAFPEVITPEIYVGTAYPGNAPNDMEKLITRPLEKEIKSISGVDEINSTSVQGYSNIQVKFNFNVTPTEALRKVKDAVDKAMGDPDFPNDLPAEPNIFEMNFSELVPVMYINLSGDYSLEQLNEWAEELEDAIEDQPGVSKVDIRGVPKKEVRVALDLHAMESREVSFDDVANAIRSENVSVSGGEVLIDGMRRTVTVDGQFTDMDQVRSIIVKQEKLDIVRIGEIADVDFTYEEPKSYAREFGKPVVMLDVLKRAGENLLVVSDSVNHLLAHMKATRFPSDLTITITGDQSDQTRTQVDELENSIIFGVVLVVGVLLFFLGLRNALFVGIAIPLSMLLSIFLLNIYGVTLNMMVLFSLVLALGMLVDNGIVVIENTYRLMSEGYSASRAAKAGIGEVAWPIIGSTATTVAVFLPLLFWPGIMGEFMKFLPITLMIVLSSSLFVAIVINPVLAALYMKVKEHEPTSRKSWRLALRFLAPGLVLSLAGHFGGSVAVFTIGNMLIAAGLMVLLNLYWLFPQTKRFQERTWPKFEEWYKRRLDRILTGRKPLWYLLGTFGLLIFSFMLMGVFPPKVEFFPIGDPQYVNIYIEEPIGTDIAKTDSIARVVEGQVLAILDKPGYKDGTENFLISSVIAQVGEGTSDPAQGPSLLPTPHKARIQVSFVKFADRKGISSTAVMDELRKGIDPVPGAVVTVEKNADGPPQGKPVNIEIRGGSIEEMIAEATRLKKHIDELGVRGVEELKIDIEQGKPEMPLEVDRSKARRFNVSTYAIGDAIRTALYGKEVSTYKEGEDDYDVVLRLKDEYRYDADALMNMRVTFRDQTNGQIRQVPISAVATAGRTSTFSAVKRQELDRVVSVQSNLLVGFNPTEVVDQIKAGLAGYDKDPRYTYVFAGQMEEQAKEMGFLSTALLMAVFLVFLIIVLQFNSASNPAIIMTSVLFSLIGVLLGLIIFRMDFIIMMTMIGLISLAGVVVNNAIVLIDFMNLLISRRKAELGVAEEGRLPREELRRAVVEAGARRLRPVILTAVTTVLGLIPLAIGFNINFFTLFTALDPQFSLGGDNTVFWGPMSWAVIFGLSFATFLTLAIVPSMYLLLTRWKYKRAEKRERLRALEEKAEIGSAGAALA